METKVTLEGMRQRMQKVSYHLMPETTTTFCQIEMKNGYVVWGKAACVDKANYNQALGEKYAYEDAINQLWPLEGYLLSEKLSEIQEA
jgi:hypothetical protein